MNVDLPSHSSVVEEKLERQHKSSWIKPMFLAIPGVPNRRLRILVPNVGPFNRQHMARIKRKRGPLLVAVACLAVFLTVVIVSKGVGHSDWNNQWQGAPTGESSTLVFKREDLQRIWKWEIASGHFPSTQSSNVPFFSLFNHRRLITFSSSANWTERENTQPCNSTSTTSNEAFKVSSTRRRSHHR